MSVSHPSTSGTTTRLAKRRPADLSKIPPAKTTTQPAKPRKKLQKNINRVGRSPTYPIGSSNSSASSLSGLPVAIHHGGPPIQPSLPSPDLSDPIWIEYLRSSRIQDPDTSPQPPEEKGIDGPPRPTHMDPVLPEFSHLAIRDASSRPSLDSSTTSTPPSSASTLPTMRRHAKTPVFSIGQLEGKAPGRGTEKDVRADQTAAQPSALFELPGVVDPIYPFESSQAESRSFVEERHGAIPTANTQPRWADRPPSITVTSIPPSPCTALHPPPPTADEGTFVEFDEEAIYFKPLSFDSEATSPLRKAEFDPPPRLPSIPQDNLGLQICTQLLTGELRKAMSDGPGSGRDSDSSALQITLMIEAYERLRDQVLELRESQPDGLSGVETMFDSWLGALYSLRNTMFIESRSLKRT